MGPVTLDSVGGGGFSSYANLSVITQQSSVTEALSAGTAGAAGAGMSASSITTTALNVQASVDALLESLGEGLASDQQLRMIIALLILNALLGKDQDQPTNKSAELAGLLTGSGLFGGRSRLAIFSATNIIQIQHQSTLVYTDQAVQTIAGDAPGGQDPRGSQLDTTG